ncbi:MAG: hypothetical protein ACUVQ8_04370 [Nitrososphaeria archaeon]
MISAWGAGRIDLNELSSKVVKVRTEFELNSSNKRTYDDLVLRYRRIVKALAEALK